ncbi:cAMP-activated global transcriptional regulator CRP [bioreactor metagenome]|uniref:cAMP-activated global transcriptional regulator CRP n=1 Tax=bioreactor metagenome TaxID=1076179 RepID=A0A645FY57_9ZZZZ
MQDDRADCFYYLISGRVKTYTIIRSDVDKRLMNYEAGSVFGLDSFFSNSLRSASASTCCKSTIAAVNAEQLRLALHAKPELYDALLSSMAQELQSMTRQAIAASGEQANTRIARYLLRSVRNSQIKTGQKTLIVKVTQDNVASQFGYSRATVNRALRYFVNQGWIRTNYRFIEIVDLAALVDFGFHMTEEKT